jgi:hypothetical protein
MQAVDDIEQIDRLRQSENYPTSAALPFAGWALYQAQHRQRDQIGSRHTFAFAAETRHADLVAGFAGPSFVTPIYVFRFGVRNSTGIPDTLAASIPNAIPLEIPRSV